MYRSVQEYRKIQCFHFCGKLWKGSWSENPNSSSEMNKSFIISANLSSNIVKYFHMCKMNLDRRNPYSIEFRARQKLDHFSNSAPQNLPDRPYRKHCECCPVSILSGHNACHEFRCSISRIVNNKGHIKTVGDATKAYRCLKDQMKVAPQHIF